jgi:hypothetical protein
VRVLALGVLGGAGLAGHLEAGDLGGDAGPALHHLEHHVAQVAGHLFGDHLAEVLALEPLDHLALVGDDLAGHERAHPPAAVGHGGGHGRHLQG